MGFSVNDKGPSTSLSEINVTPLVDVMLVLLIIFMISAPLLQSGVDVELPQGSMEKAAEEEYLIVTLDAQGKAYLNDEWLQPQVLMAELKKKMDPSGSRTVYLRGDKRLSYGEVMTFLDTLKQGGVERVSLIMEPVQQR
jgi:TolR protein